MVVVCHPIQLAALVLLFSFGQDYGAAAHVQVFVQVEFNLFLTVGREIKKEEVVAVELVFVFGLEDGFLRAVEDYGTGLGFGRGCSIFLHRAAVAQYEGVLLAVETLYAPVFQPDVDGAIGRAARGERAGGEAWQSRAESAVSLEELSAIGLIAKYQPIILAVVWLFGFGQVYGAAAHMQVFVQADRHPFLTVGREVEVELVVAVALVFVFGIDDGFLCAVEGYGLRLGCGRGRCSAASVIIVVTTRAGGERRAHHHCCCEGKSLACRVRKEIIAFHCLLCPPAEISFRSNAVSGARALG